MAQHFLLSAAAKSLSLVSIFGMKDADAEMTFRRIRWHETSGEPVCSHCGGTDAYDCRRLKGAPRPVASPSQQGSNQPGTLPIAG